MSKEQFVYVTYIASTPEIVWNALQDEEFTQKYWANHRNVSDWKVGSPWRHEDRESGAIYFVGTVLESNPPNRLVVSWELPEGQPSFKSHVEYDIAATDGVVRLMVTHRDLESNAALRAGLSTGWPIFLSSLKSLLETGKALPAVHM